MNLHLNGCATVKLRVLSAFGRLSAVILMLHAATVIPALASAPAAYTGPALMVTATNAVLSGMVLANGAESQAWFEWGTTRTYGNQTALFDVGSDAYVVYVTNHIEGLIPGNNYHFRIVVSNSSGTAYGADQIFGVGQKIWAWGNSEFGQTNVPKELNNVAAIAAGDKFSLALRHDGTVVGWGANLAGPLEIPLGNVLGIAGGYGDGFALRSDRTLASFDLGAYGAATTPVGLTNIVAVAAGISHTVALKSDGTVTVWGWNDRGQTNKPAGLTNVVAIAANGWHSMALKIDGTVAAWGYLHYLPSGYVPSGLSNVVAIACGYLHNMALKRDGTVVVWGSGTQGSPPVVPAGLSNVVAISAGIDNCMAIKTDGTLAYFGITNYGQADIPVGMSNLVAVAGLGTHVIALQGQSGTNLPPTVDSQTVLAIPNSDTVIKLDASDASGDLFVLRISALPEAGVLYQYTPSGRGQAITAVDTLVDDRQNRVIFVPSVQSGSTSFHVIANDGILDSSPATIHINISGMAHATTQPATMITYDDAVLTGMAVPNGVSTKAWFEWGTNRTYEFKTPVVDIGAGCGVIRLTNRITGLHIRQPYHFRLVASNSFGTVYGADQQFASAMFFWAWGSSNVPPQLGDLVSFSAGERSIVGIGSSGSLRCWGITPPPGLYRVQAGSCGKDHAIVITTNGTVLCWGGNGFGQTNTPAGLSNVVAVAAGEHASMALRSDGTVAVWGAIPQSTVPEGLSNVVAIACGDNAMALKSDGTVVCWDAYGPVPVPEGLNKVVAITASDGRFNAALKEDGKIALWGNATFHEVTEVPPGLEGVVSIASGSGSMVVLKDDGTVTSWGYNKFNQVPNSLSNVVAIGANAIQCFALGGDPVASVISKTVSGSANSDLVIRLEGIDPQERALTFYLSTMPARGKLYQYASGQRGSAIDIPYHSTVTDPSGRVIFVPEPNAHASNYTSFQVIARNGYTASPSETITIDILGVPIAVTQPAVINTMTNALLNGLVTPNGFKTMAWFEWGISTNYGNTMGFTNVGASNAAVPVTNLLKNLSPDVVYHYRVAASNSVGITYGEDRMFSIDSRPVASKQSAYISPRTLIVLSGTDPRGASLTFRITALPQRGVLRQYNSGMPGAIVNAIDTPVTDPLGRIFFLPDPNQFVGPNITSWVYIPYATFQYVANNGTLDSLPATVNLWSGISLPNWSISRPIPSSGSAFNASFTGFTNQVYNVLVSTNLVDWQPLCNAVETAAGQFEFTDNDSTNHPARFYKVVAP